jgi:hypothetical protein
MKDRVSRLRVEWDGDPADVKEWHAIVDMMDDRSTEDFLDTYGRVSEVPSIVSGVGDDGLQPDESNDQ